MTAVDDLLGRAFLFHQAAQHVVQHLVGGQRVLIGLVGPELRARRLLDDRLGNHRPLRPLQSLHPVPVAPAGHLEHVGLVDVLQHRIAAAHVAVESGVAHRHLGLVAGGEHHVAELVADRHQDDAAHPRLDVLLGLVGFSAGEDRRQHAAERIHRRLDPQHLVADSEQACALGRVVEGGLRRVARRHDDAEHPVGAQRIDGDGGRQRRIDAAGKPDEHAGEAVLPDVIGQPQRHGAVGRRVAVRQCGARAGRAGPPVAFSRPAGEHDRFLKRRRLGGEAVVGVEHERSSVEDQFVLAAHLVRIDQRQLGLADAGNGAIEADILLVALKGRAVDDDHDFGARFHQALGDLGEPHVLADHGAEADAAKRDRPRQPGAREHPHLVEDAVVGQLVLVSSRRDLAAVEQERGVVELAVVDPGRADEERGPAVRGRCRECFHDGPRLLLEHRLEHEVLGRVAGHRELGADHEVGALGRGLGAGTQDQRLVALQIPHGGVELGECDGERVGHGRPVIHKGAGGCRPRLSMAARFAWPRRARPSASGAIRPRHCAAGTRGRA